MSNQTTELNAELEAAIDLYMQEQVEKHGGVPLKDYLRVREEARQILKEAFAQDGGQDGSS